MLILRIGIAPFALIFSLITTVISFLLSASTAFFSIISSLAFIGAVILFISGEPTGGIAFLVVSFLVSPFGLPALAGWMTRKMNHAGNVLRYFVIS